jgi:hypothetical protein
MNNITPYLLQCLLFFSAMVTLRIVAIIFFYNQHSVATTFKDLLSALIATGIWLVLMFVFKGFKKEKSQKVEI